MLYRAMIAVQYALLLSAFGCASAAASTCYLSREQDSGLNRHCFYRCVDGEKAVTIKSPAYCASSVEIGEEPLTRGRPRASAFEKFADAFDQAAKREAQFSRADEPARAIARKVSGISHEFGVNMYTTPSMKMDTWIPTNAPPMQANNWPLGVVVIIRLDCRMGESGCAPPRYADPMVRSREASYCSGELSALRRDGLAMIDMFVDRDSKAFRQSLSFAETDCK